MGAALFAAFGLALALAGLFLVVWPAVVFGLLVLMGSLYVVT